MTKIAALLFGVATLTASAALGAPPAGFKGRELASRAKISLEQARQTALKARPGKIADEELEKERGGSGLRYSFDILSHGRTVEVGVDAVTGKILENGAESAAKEAREAARER